MDNKGNKGESWGNWMRQTRRIRGNTLDAIARNAGVSNQSNLSKAERGEIVPEPETMERLAPFYGSPWLPAPHNALFIRSLGWVFTARVGYHPIDDDETAAVDLVESALSASDGLLAHPPTDPDLNLRLVAARFRETPGLARMGWADSRPFWTWIWIQHAFHIQEGRHRLHFDIRAMSEAFEEMQTRQRFEERLLRGWPQWDAVWQTVESVGKALAGPQGAWYQYPLLDVSDYALDDVEEGPIDFDDVPVDFDAVPAPYTTVRTNEPPSDPEEANAPDVTGLFDRLRVKCADDPEWVKLLDRLSRYPESSISALNQFLETMEPLDIFMPELPF